MTARTGLRVMTMNAYGPANPDWDRRHRLLGDTIRELDPDVIALQEVPLDLDGDLGRILGPRLSPRILLGGCRRRRGDRRDPVAAPPHHRG